MYFPPSPQVSSPTHSPSLSDSISIMRAILRIAASFSRCTTHEANAARAMPRLDSAIIDMSYRETPTSSDFGTLLSTSLALLSPRSHATPPVPCAAVTFFHRAEPPDESSLACYRKPPPFTTTLDARVQMQRCIRDKSQTNRIRASESETRHASRDWRHLPSLEIRFLRIPAEGWFECKIVARNSMIYGDVDVKRM